MWNDQKRAESLGRKRATLESVLEALEGLWRTLSESEELLALAVDENDQATADEIAADVERMRLEVKRLEFQRMFSGDTDAANAFLDVQAGSGGTEAQDWADLLLRM